MLDCMVALLPNCSKCGDGRVTVAQQFEAINSPCSPPAAMTLKAGNFAGTVGAEAQFLR